MSSEIIATGQDQVHQASNSGLQDSDNINQDLSSPYGRPVANSLADSTDNSLDFQRITLEKKKNKKLLIARSVFTASFILVMAVIAIVRSEKTQYLAEGECLRDYTFVWTKPINEFFVENTPWKNFLIIQSSVGIDFMMLSFLVVFAKWGTTMRLAAALILMYPIRNVLQAVFLMGRPVGFLWSYPGIISLTVPYFDTNDFYFSGHVGSTTTFASEYFAMKWYKMASIISFCVVDVWISLMFLRTHYIIDFVSGYACARVFHRLGEKLSYYPDVKILGWPREKRFPHNYDPCPRCGWGNEALLRVTVQEDIDVQKKVYKRSLANGKAQVNDSSPLIGARDDESISKPNQHSQTDSKPIMNSINCPVEDEDGILKNRSRV